MVLGQLPPRKIAPNPNFNANPKLNPNPNRGGGGGGQFSSGAIVRSSKYSKATQNSPEQSAELTQKLATETTAHHTHDILILSVLTAHKVGKHCFVAWNVKLKVKIRAF